MEHDGNSEKNLETSQCTLVKNGYMYYYNPTDTQKWLKMEFQTNLSRWPDLKFSEEKLHRLIQILGGINVQFSLYNDLDTPMQETLTETLKSFRIYVLNDDVAKYVINDSEFAFIISNLIQFIFTKKNGPELYTKYLLQLFLNLLSGGSEEKRKKAKEIIESYFTGQFYRYFMESYGHIYETSALLYHFVYDVDLTDYRLINHIIFYYGDPTTSNEYLGFIMEKLITTYSFWQNYEQFDVKTRLTLLSCLREVLIGPKSEDLQVIVKTLPTSCLKCFTAVFNRSVNVVFQVTQAGCSNAAHEVSYILELLAHISSEEESLKLLQTNKDLFINAGVLLVNVHRLGQTSNNIFTPIQKLADNRQPSSGMRNPVLGFKADLTRLIGNLCWKDRRMQDLAREAKLIPVLLDCCNIDENNPFIIQWVVLAVRNLCENNTENQAIIAGLTRQGVMDAGFLQNHGVILHAGEDQSIGIIDLGINKEK